MANKRHALLTSVAPPWRILCYISGMETTAYYVTKIKEDLSLRQRQNPHYSLRAYARDVGLHPSTLSKIIKGIRPLPLKNSKILIEKMNLGPKERTLFMESLLQSKVRLDQIKLEASDERFMLDESYYKVIAEWEHFAILSLFDLNNFVPSVEGISDRLGITENRAEVVLNNLLTCGLVARSEEGTLVKTHASVRTTEDISSQAIKEGHRDALEMGKDKLDKIAVELRDFSEVTISTDPDKLAEAKTIIREFRQKMSKLLRDGNRREVYQLAIQFYPLTEPLKN